MMLVHYINQKIVDGILHLELNRQEVRNAINMGMVEQLQYAFIQAEENADIRVILVRGVGEKSFSSGGDLVEFHSITTKADALDMMNRVAQLLNQISSSSKLTIAAINGYALGGGAELTTAFDLRIASEAAKIGFVQSKLGITTAWGGGTRLLSIIGKVKALPLLIKGEILSANQWMELGYINHIIPHSSFSEESIKFATQFTDCSFEIIKSYKHLSECVVDSSLIKRSISAEIEQAATLWISDEHLQVANQFLQKKQDR